MPTIIALHYWAGAGHEYNQLLDLLPPDTRLLAPDLPGFGQQPLPPGFELTVAANTDWVERYIAEQQVREYYVIGHSMGGKFALALAARQPQGLRGLLLLAPSPPTPEPMTPQDREASREAWGKRDEAEKTARKITHRPLSEGLIEQIVADNLRTTHAAWEAWLDVGSQEVIADQMPRIQVPCSLLVGSDDHGIPTEAQFEQTHPLLPAGTPLVVVPGAGHLLPYEAPDEVAKALTDLLAR